MTRIPAWAIPDVPTEPCADCGAPVLGGGRCEDCRAYFRMIENGGGVLTPRLPREFGQGWMSANARDLCRIVVAFGGVDPVTLLRELRPGSRLLTTRAVESALRRLRAAHK